MKEWLPSNLSPKELDEEIRKAKEESDKLTEWPDPDNYVD